MFSSNRKTPPVVKKIVTEVSTSWFKPYLFGDIFAGMMSKLSLVTIYLTVFAHKDNIAIVRELLGINFNLFERTSNMCWLISSVPKRTSTISVSATRNLHPTGKCAIVT